MSNAVIFLVGQADSAGTPRPDDDIVSFFERSWRDVKDALAQNISEGHPEAQQKSAARRTVVHYRPASPSILTGRIDWSYENLGNFKRKAATNFCKSGTHCT